MKQLRGKPLKDFLKQASRPDRELIFILQDVEDPVNVGSAFRIADAAGVRQLILTGISARPPHPSDSEGWTGRRSTGEVEVIRNRQRTQFLALKAQGYVSCALEITAASVPYNETEISR